MIDLYKAKFRDIVEMVISRWPTRISLSKSGGEPLDRRVEFGLLFEDRLQAEIEEGLGRLAVQANWLIFSAGAKIIATEDSIDRSQIDVDEVVEKLRRLIESHGFPQLDGVHPDDGSFDLDELRVLRQEISGADESS